jgi:hypothetical protein
MSAQNSNVLVLTNDWRIQSSEQIARAKEKVATTSPRDRTLLDTMRRTNAAAISTRRFRATGDWIPATVPTTVLAVLVKHGNVKTNSANLLPAPLTNSWWFRKEFSVSKTQAAENAGLIFNGIHFRADIWLNGEQIAGAENTTATPEVFKLDVSGKLRRGKNVLAVEIFPAQPPDRELGLRGPVELQFDQSPALNY